MYETVESGDINRVPLIIGINSEEQIAKVAGLYKVHIIITIFNPLQNEGI